MSFSFFLVIFMPFFVSCSQTKGISQEKANQAQESMQGMGKATHERNVGIFVWEVVQEDLFSNI